ncbi:hypothetical protein [Paenibacillus planticolens]|uniref:Uncharacterized protein n=1 Tax=Paenibacillus planticolens TaxID=2654976 RepID=A0ABX1ZM91_9BACL|nr:hypothetical protein [Paenibacillus planticolens]NOV00808.1 hypothetical protein [Paenibacillus planticolens]
MPPNLMTTIACHHPLGSALTGGAGLFREKSMPIQSSAVPIINVSELDALHRHNVALYVVRYYKQRPVPCQ